jgi:lipopolysaccharide heptosyltransferase II
MTTAAIRALKEARAGRHVTLMTSPAGAPVASLVPEIDDFMAYDAPWMKATPPRASSQPEFGMIERLRAGRFDAAAIFTVYSQNPLPSALLCYLAGIPLRLAHCHENPYQLLTDWVPDPEPARTTRHEVRRQLDLVASVGCRAEDERLSLRVPAAARRRVATLLDASGIDRARPWVLVHTGATAPSRRYPPGAFAQVARHLVAEEGWQVVFTGTPPERPLVESIRQAMRVPSRSLVGRLGLPELVAVIAAAPLLLSNNTGPVHIAAAVGTPVVDLYALTNPQHVPWAVPSRVLSHDVPCKWCYKSVCPEGHNNCLTLVTPESVVRAVTELYLETAGRTAAQGPGVVAVPRGRRRVRPQSAGAW